MNMMTTGSDIEFVPTKAEEWLVALSDHPADIGLRAQFEAWLAMDSRNALEWAEATHVDNLIKANGALKAIPMPSRHRSRRVAAVVGLAAAAAIALGITPGLVLRMQADFVAPSSTAAAITLSDGSRLHLAPSSAISVNFHNGERGVKLLKGEAYFEVVPDANRPFRVIANGAQIVVLGTAFDVRSDAGATTVAVRNGMVQVEPIASSAAPVRLHAGDTMNVASSGEIAQGKQPPEQAGAWSRGKLIVRERPVSEVIGELRRYYAGFIVLRGDGLNDRVVTGIFDLTKPREAAEAIAAVHGGIVQKFGPVLIIHK